MSFIRLLFYIRGVIERYGRVSDSLKRLLRFPVTLST